MIKTDGAKLKAQTYFEQVPFEVVEKLVGREAVRTHGGPERRRETAAKAIQPHNPAGSMAERAIKSKGQKRPR